MHFVSEDARLRAAAPGLTQSLAESLASAWLIPAAWRSATSLPAKATQCS